MGKANTGMQRAAVLTVTKRIGSEVAVGYPRRYRVGDAFDNFSQLTDVELSSIAATDYLARLNAFKLRIERIEQGVTVDIDTAYRENNGECPI